jgi:hypothetical protein
LLSGLSLGVKEVHRGSLRAVLMGLLRLPSPYVSDIARGLGEEFGPSLDAREHRLLRFLGSPKLHLGHFKAALQRELTGALPRQGRIFLYGDLSDLAKPYALRMQGLDWVRDASDPEERIVRGYWLNEVYVELDPYRVAPVVFELFSLRSGETLSQNNVVLRGMDEAFRVTGPRGVFVADQGLDANYLFDDLLRKSRDFILRVKVGTSSRNLLLADGHLATISTLLKHLPLPEMLYEDGALRKLGTLGWVKVRLPGHPDRTLTLVVAHLDGFPEPMALLTTLAVADPKVARRIVAAYLRRWNAAEDSIRFVKQAFRLEKYLVATFRRMKVWVFMVGVATALLTLLNDPRSVGKRLVRSYPSFSQRVRTLHYRLAWAVSGILRALSPLKYHAFASGP